MTLVSWLVWRILGSPEPPAGGVYWIGIVAAALAFALAHLPFLYSVASSPPLWLPLAALAINGVVGMVFGWLFWRRGLEAAFMAHMLAHVTAALIGMAA
jgi:membrane protease YdiL (CAAX protease family)